MNDNFSFINMEAEYKTYYLCGGTGTRLWPYQENPIQTIFANYSNINFLCKNFERVSKINAMKSPS